MTTDPMAAALVEDLERELGEGRARREPLELGLYARDAGVSEGRAAAVCFPRTAGELASAVRLASRHDRPFVVRGAGTGLAGGATPVGEPLVVVTTRMNRVLEIDACSRVAWVEPGVLNLDLTREVQHLGLHYAPDPSSQQACTIGGNVGTNAGGPHCLSYGVTGAHVLAVEVVLPDGDVEMLGGLMPDAPGYDLRGCFVGSEGTMGVATRIAVRLTPDPPALSTILVAFDAVEDAGATVSGLIARGVVPAALEMMDSAITRAVEDFVGAGYPRDAAAVLLIEVDGLTAGVAEEVAIVREVATENSARSVRVAADDTERALLWKGRKSAFGAVARIAPDYYLHDAVVPRTRLVDVLQRVYEVSDEYDLQMLNVFHAGDGNLHPLIAFDRRVPGVWERVHEAGDAILTACIEAGGVLSGEHGVGLEKRHLMNRVFTPEDLDAQARLRDAFDPHGRANPGKVLPTGSRCADVGAVRTHATPDDAVADFEGAETPLTSGAALPSTVPTGELATLCERVADAEAVLPVGGRTQWEVGGVPTRGDEIPSLSGIVAYDPAELTVTVGAGTTVGELAATLAVGGQQCVLDPEHDDATVGGVLATGLSGHRRLRHGPLRDVLLEVRFIAADGAVVRAGGPTVKNVTGFDLCRLFVGSLGTLGLMTQVTLRCIPLPAVSRWGTATGRPDVVARSLFRPSCVLYDGAITRVLLEGTEDDVIDQFRVSKLTPVESPEWPMLRTAPHRGRMSVAPGRLHDLWTDLARLQGVTAVSETGVGTVHVGCSDVDGLLAARRIATDHGGWLLREAGAPGVDPFGTVFPAVDVTQRVRDAFDPSGKFSPGRLPL